MSPRMADAMTRARAWLTLALVPGLGPVRARRLVERFGSPEAVCALSRSALAGAGVVAAALDGWSRAGELAARELGRLARLGASLRVWDDAGYPARLRAIADPPLAIAVRGTLEADQPAGAPGGAPGGGGPAGGGAGGGAPRAGGSPRSWPTGWRQRGSRWSADSPPGSMRPPIAGRSPPGAAPWPCWRRASTACTRPGTPASHARWPRAAPWSRSSPAA